jgi:phosphoenolpyruvate synthase/pyruvate phosphate dikinase
MSRMSMASRRDMLQSQAETDHTLFDSSLGCPLSSYDHASLALVGGKALQCWRLMRHGLNVPAAFIIPTYVYSLHIEEAGVVNLVNEVYSSDMRDDTVREDAKVKLDEIREKIMETPLNAEVVSNLKTFLKSLGDNSDVAVRSSGSAEDLASQSFAGQYATFLYKREPEEIHESIKACWASMFNSYILDYATRPAFLEKEVGDAAEPNVFTPSSVKPPRMGVLVMKMVEAKVSGVCFTKNLWGAVSEIMVEAVLGQGEGLVGGEITPDRYVVDKNSSKLCYQDTHTPTHKFIRSSNTGGVEKVAVDPSRVKGPVLDAAMLKVSLRWCSVRNTHYLHSCFSYHADLTCLMFAPLRTFLIYSVYCLHGPSRRGLLRQCSGHRMGN